MKPKKIYVVLKGRVPGLYYSWTECKKQIDGFSGAMFKAYSSYGEADIAFKTEFSKANQTSTVEPIWDSVSVDASCIGNPGKMEFRAVKTATGEELFRKEFSTGTNNIGEFLAVVSALAYTESKGLSIPIYTDSMTALSWLRTRTCKTSFAEDDSSRELFTVIHKAEEILRKHEFKSNVLKWETHKWGEIPADFGRK